MDGKDAGAQDTHLLTLLQHRVLDLIRNYSGTRAIGILPALTMDLLHPQAMQSKGVRSPQEEAASGLNVNVSAAPGQYGTDLAIRGIDINILLINQKLTQ